jgi:hypothetical protein
VVRFVVCAIVLAIGSALSSGQYTVSILDTPGHEQSSYSSIFGANAAGHAALPTSNYRAMMWNQDGALITSLHPTGYDSSRILGMSRMAQVGVGSAVPDEPVHALLWHNSAESMIDLQPADWETSWGHAVSDHGQAGYGVSSSLFGNGSKHAAYWNGSAETMVDLQPAGEFWSEALGIGNDFEVGYVYGNRGKRPYLWRDTAASGIDLGGGNGSGEALAASASKQVGYLTRESYSHAALWSGTAASFVDLHPAGFDSSEASAISWSGEYQVGQASTSNTSSTTRAMMWRGYAGSEEDLHTYLETLPYTISRSIALGVSDSGDVIGLFQEPNFNSHFVRWNHVVPEPNVALATIIGVGFLIRRTRPTRRIQK